MNTCFSRRSLRRVVVVLLFSCLPGPLADVQADEPAESEKESPLMQQAREFVRQTKVEVLNDDGSVSAIAMASPHAVLTYGDLSRDLDSSSLWGWTHDGEPIAMMKVEQYVPKGRSLWMFCFSNLSPYRIRMSWDFQPTPYTLEPLSFQPIPLAQTPPETSDRGRQFQMRAIAREFVVFENIRKNLEQLRLMPNPLLENRDPESRLTRGAVFGQAVATNPDGSLVLRIASRPDGSPEWTFAPVRMSYGGLKFQHHGEDVFVDLQNEMTGHHVRWGYFHISRDQ